MQLVAGIGSLNLPELFAGAEKRIILHAAVYGPFADSPPHREGLSTALERPSFERLDIVALQEGQPWTATFMNALRFGADKEEQSAALRASHNFLNELKAAYSGKVHVHPQKTIPCLPVIIVNDTIVFGQYVHCEAYAASGFWGTIETDVEKLLNWASGPGLPSDATNEEVAAYRMVSECHHAMNGGPQ